MVTATSGLPPLRDFHFTEFARQTFPSGLTPAVKDCFGLHGHYAFGSVAKEKSGVGRKSATSVGLTTDLVHWLHAGKTVDFLRCASEINRLFPSSALSIFRINRNSFHIILAVSNNCRIFATRISATPLIQAYQGGTYFFIDAMQYTNRPLTIQDQISRLQNNGLIISDVAKAESELKNIGVK